MLLDPKDLRSMIVAMKNRDRSPQEQTIYDFLRIVEKDRETVTDKLAQNERDIFARDVEIERLRSALAEARKWLASIERALMAEGMSALKPTFEKIDAALANQQTQERA